MPSQPPANASASGEEVYQGLRAQVLSHSRARGVFAVAASKESAMVADGFFNPVFYFSHSSTNSPSHPESSPGSSRTHHQRWEVRVLEILNRAAAGEHPN